MQATIPRNGQWHRLLQPLLTLDHPHLQPLKAVGLREGGMDLHYGQPGPCPPLCTGLWGAVRAVHGVGLWVGDVLGALGKDDVGRSVIAGIGSGWVLGDPFAGHPSVQGSHLRIGWRQRADLQQLSALDAAVTDCQS
jgi:hypothetical protein